MHEQYRSPQAITLAPGKPNVPEPHPADYSSEISEDALDLIDEVCPQSPGGKVIKRFEW